ncbi:MAG TPA: ABC transporter permease subunit [Candidatus Saccharimonadia bacterium]|nr:ABC transporter permease subunit [Candidatus Saccharimonadia bacterium]
MSSISHYHRIVRHGRHHHRHHWASFILLAIGIAGLSLASRGSLDTLVFLRFFAGSLLSVTIAYVVCLVLGLLIGLAAVVTPRLEALLLPIIDLAQSFPTFAVLPVLVFYFGHTRITVVTILVIAMIWPIVFSVIGGFKEQREDETEAALIFGARGWRHFAYYLWPLLRPQVITGSIISWGQAWDTIVGAEIIAGVAGAGHYLGGLGDRGNIQVLALGIFVYLFLIFAINQVLWLPLLHRYTKYTAES